MSTHADNAVAIRNLSVRYGRRLVLDSVSLDIGTGVTALVGPNGSGKSTLLRVLATLVRIDSGSIRMHGHDVAGIRGGERARELIGYLPQDPTDLAHLTVREACYYSMWLHGIRRRRRVEQCTYSLEELGLVDVQGHLISSLSGGTRRRAYLATVLACRPSVILLDEPTAGLDTAFRHQVIAAIRNAARESSVVFSTHLAEDIDGGTQRVVALRGGNVSFDGNPDQLVALATDSAIDNGPLDRAVRMLGKP